MSQNDVLNIAKLEGFTGPLEDKQLLEFINNFEENLSIKMVQFTQLISSQEYLELRDIAHSLKSTATLIGAESLCLISAKFEQKVNEKMFVGIDVLAESLIFEANRVLNAIGNEKKNIG